MSGGGEQSSNNKQRTGNEQQPTANHPAKGVNYEKLSIYSLQYILREFGIQNHDAYFAEMLRGAGVSIAGADTAGDRLGAGPHVTFDNNDYVKPPPAAASEGDAGR